MEISQKKYSNRVRYVFGDEELDYHVQDSSGSRSFSVPYSAISRDRQTPRGRAVPDFLGFLVGEVSDHAPTITLPVMQRNPS